MKTIEGLDAFKLDEIARNLKEVEQNHQRSKSNAQDIVNLSKTLGSPADRERVGDYSRVLMEQFDEARLHLKNTIETCLSELLKYHIGSGTKAPE